MIGMINILDSEDELFPKRLYECSDHPSVLYYSGDASILSENIIAVIGQRDVSERYKAIAYRVGRILAENNYVVLNGLAVGCDKSALMGALSKNGKTIAVMPCGLDTVYPSSCKKIADEIIANGGCIVSQYPVGTKPVKYRFVERDKIQAKISSKVMVISAGLSGGTMKTVTFAQKEGREIGCFIESKIPSPEGNAYICEKMDSYKITDTDTLLDFAAEQEEKQLSFL
jgi:DNA processing protein